MCKHVHLEGRRVRGALVVDGVVDTELGLGQLALGGSTTAANDLVTRPLLHVCQHVYEYSHRAAVHVLGKLCYKAAHSYMHM